MAKLTTELKNDLKETRNKVKETRLNLTGGVIEKKAKKAGVSIKDFSKDTYQKMDESIDNLSNKFETGAYKTHAKLKDGGEDLAKDLKDLHKSIKSKRRDITGGHLEDKTVEILKAAEKKLDDMIKKIKD